MRKINDLKGKRFGRLLVINLHGTIKGRAFWNCICDCGKLKIANSILLTTEQTTSCGCKSKDINRKRLRLPQGISGFNTKKRNYIHGAIKRNLEFNLTDEELHILFKGNCFYCNIEPRQVSIHQTRNGEKDHSRYIYNGIDRVDNNKGYNKDNCVSCCKFCNRVRLYCTQKEFLEWIDRIILLKQNKNKCL